MKKILIFLSAVGLTIGLYAKPEKGGKKTGSGEGRPSREEVMKKFDKDGDGKLNEEEKAELRKKMAERGAGRKAPPFIMEKFDKDGDGKLSEDERAEARKAMEARRAEMIEKFDKDGEYTRKFVPELEKLPDKFLFTPWEAPQSVLEAAGIELGKDYPYPIIDLKQSRAIALEAFASIKKE